MLFGVMHVQWLTDGTEGCRFWLSVVVLVVAVAVGVGWW